MPTSIMMTTFNRLELTKQTLNSLFETTNSPFRLFIVDNGSTDATVEYLHNLQNQDINCKELINIEIHFNDKNLGIGKGRNRGLKMASRYDDELLSTIDNDVLLPNGWLSEIIDIIKVNPDFAIGVNMEGISYPVKTINGKSFQVKPMGNLGTALTVFPRELHRKIGYFNDFNSQFGEDDADFFFRARMLDYKMGYLKEMGTHLGQGENDIGPYREFKDKCHADNLKLFRYTCHQYMAGTLSYFIPYSE
jgi:glycosyltransferase involved in cell wall biosynthesis